MTTLPRLTLALLFTAAASLPLPALAVNCSQLADTEPEDAYTLNVRDIERCIQRGWDPPVNWRPDRGRGISARVSGGGGFNVTTVQAPDRPPAVRGLAPSVSQNTIKFSLGFPPWPGFPCQLPGGINLCGGDDDDNGGGDPTGPTVGTCPIEADTTGTFGQKQPITGGQSYSLACGGAVPLSTYQITLSKNPSGMAATEHGSPYIWMYKAGNSAGKTVFQTVGGSPFALPTHLCKKQNGEMKKSIDLKGPAAQMILYSGSSTTLAIRMIPNEDLPDPLSAQASNSPERYLLIPVKNGVPQVPGNCANEDDVLKPLSTTSGDLIFEAMAQATCEGLADYCAKHGGGAPTTSTPPNCEAVTVYPSSNNSGSSSGSTTTDCSATSQLMVVDRPNLLYPPGASATSHTIEGRTAVLSATTEGSEIYTSSEAIIRLNRTIHTFELPQGGIMGLNNGGRLMMAGPARVNSNMGVVHLDNGGEVRDAGGNTLATYKPGVTITPTTTWPVAIRLNRNIKMPAGYYMPTQPNPYIVGPITEP